VGWPGPIGHATAAQINLLYIIWQWWHIVVYEIGVPELLGVGVSTQREMQDQHNIFY